MNISRFMQAHWLVDPAPIRSQNPDERLHLNVFFFYKLQKKSVLLQKNIKKSPNLNAGNWMNMFLPQQLSDCSFADKGVLIDQLSVLPSLLSPYPHSLVPHHFYNDSVWRSSSSSGSSSICLNVVVALCISAMWSSLLVQITQVQISAIKRGRSSSSHRHLIKSGQITSLAHLIGQNAMPI